MTTATKELYTVTNGELKLNFHPGQTKAYDSPARYVVVLAGTQGGKTSFGPWWLYEEIRQQGPGDYLVVAPTFPLLQKKLLPEFLKIFKRLLQLGDYTKSDKIFTFDALGEMRMWGDEQEVETRIVFGHAQDSDALESATAKAAWLDEAGQNKFKLASFEAIRRRLSLHRGRCLITTTPYNLGWVKQQLHDKASERDDIEIIRFDSTENPAFPKEEMEEARRDLPLWKFNMFYRALFTRPAGMIYDCFDEAIHKVSAFPIPDNWERYMGQDYGGVNTAAVYLAKQPNSNRYFLYREYWQGGLTAKGHAEKMLQGEPVTPLAYGGARSEDQWRKEFWQGGIYVKQPAISDVEVGITRVYGAFQRHELFIFDTCVNTLDEVMSYSRELDDNNNPTERIADKNTFHLLDGLRYVGSSLFGITTLYGAQIEGSVKDGGRADMSAYKVQRGQMDGFKSRRRK